MKNIKPWWKEYFIYDATKALTAGSGTIFENINIKMDTDSNFELYKTCYVATNDRIKIKIKDGATGQYLFKDAVDIKTIAGRNILPIGLSNSFIPFVWPRPYLITAGSVFTIEAADNSSATNTMRLALHGAKIRPGIPPWQKQFKRYMPFVYGFTNGPVSVSANSTAIGRIEIDIDANFLVQKIVGIRTSEAIVTLVESERNRDWSNAAIHIDNLVGNGSFPNIIPANRFIRKGSIVIANITDLSGSTNIIEINIVGVKLYE